MKILLLKICLLSGLLFINGCSTKPDFTHYSWVRGDYYYKPGITFANKKKDFESCVVAAAKSIKSNRIKYFKPLQTEPIFCSSTGGSVFCSGGGTTGGYESSWDDNIGRRHDHVEQCLKKKGYLHSRFSTHKCEYNYRPSGDYRTNSPVINSNQIICGFNTLIPYDKVRFNEGFELVHGYSESYLTSLFIQ